MPYKDPTQLRLALHYSFEYLRRVELVASSLRRKDALPDIYNRNSPVVLRKDLCKMCLVY